MPAKYLAFIHEPRLAVVNFQAPEMIPFVLTHLDFERPGLGLMLTLRKQELIRTSRQGLECSSKEPPMPLGIYTSLLSIPDFYAMCEF